MNGSPVSIPTELQIGIELIHKIRGEGITIVMVEHVMEAIRALCDHVVVMNAGERIAQGTPNPGPVGCARAAGLFGE